MDLSTVIVYYRSLDVLGPCLRSLETSTRGLGSEVVVVDNDSRDGMAEVLGRQHPEVRLIQNRENLGFARAVNQGIAATTGEFVLLLNPDCFLEPGAIAALLEHCRAHPRTGIAGPQLLDGQGRVEYSARSFPDAYALFFNRYSLLTRLFPRNRHSRRYLMSDWDHASVRDVDWLSGACLLARRQAIEEVGPMDEAYFMFNEDVDWCRRMSRAGWTVTYVPAARAVHHVGASRGRVAARVILERHRGMMHYLHKHHPTPAPLRLLADAAILMRAGLMLTANALRPR